MITIIKNNIKEYYHEDSDIEKIESRVKKELIEKILKDLEEMSKAKVYEIYGEILFNLQLE